MLNASSIADDIDPKPRAFLDYVVGKPSEDEYKGKLEEAVKKAKANKLWRVRSSGGRRCEAAARTGVKRRQSI